MNSTNGFADILAGLTQGKVVQIVMIITAAWLFITVSQRFLPWLAEQTSGRARQFLLASVPLLRLSVLILAFVLILPRLIEPTVENLVALLGALALALGFAFKDYASSLIAGVVALYETPFRLGDWIEVSGTYGEVKGINMRTVRVVTPDDTVVHIPHLKLWDHLIHNANDGGLNLLCVADFYLHPSHDADLVRHVFEDVALTSPYVQLDQPITVIVAEKPWGTHYRLKAYPVNPRQQFLFTTDLTVRGKAALGQRGVKFALIPAVAS